MAESEEELKSLLMKVKEKSEKVGLKFKIQKTKTMASGPITSWQINGKQWKQWETLFWGLQNHCRWWLQPWNKKMLAPWKESYNQPAAAKLLQSCPTLCDPTRLPRPWDSPGKNTGVDCHFLLQCMKTKSENEVAQSCPTLSDPMDCSLPGSSIHGIFQARVLEWGAIAFSVWPS